MAHMAEQEQTRRTTTSTTESQDVEAPPADRDSSEQLKAELDDILDQIDQVLEENAEDFVRNYVQKGGE